MTVQLQAQGWISMFTQMRRPASPLSRNFTMKPGGSYKGVKVTIDIERYGEEVAIAVKAFKGVNMNDFDEFTTKEFTPPAYGEGFPLNVNDQINRIAGQDPYSAAYAEAAGFITGKAAKGFALIDDKISRAIELQAAQIYQTGQLSLTNKDGAVEYSLDFKPKASHFPTVGTAWSEAGATPLADIEAVAKLIRADGKVDPNELHFGETAMSEFLSHSTVKEYLDTRRIEMGQINPRYVDSGVTYYGDIWIGTYKFQMYVHSETYDHPQSGAPTKYVIDNSVIVTSSRTRLDLVAAKVPEPIAPDPRVANLLPGRMVSRTGGFDVTPNIYASPNGKQIIGELESRPLLVPVQIDGFGCLTT